MLKCYSKKNTKNFQNCYFGSKRPYLTRKSTNLANAQNKIQCFSKYHMFWYHMCNILMPKRAIFSLNSWVIERRFRWLSKMISICLPIIMMKQKGWFCMLTWKMKSVLWVQMALLCSPKNALKMKFSINDLFSKCDQIHSILRMWSFYWRYP